MQTIYLDPNQVPSHWKGDYRGKTFRACITESVNVADSTMRWDNGSRSVFTIWNGEHSAIVPEIKAWPHYGEQMIVLKPGCVLVEHAIVAGKDYGITIYAHPDDVVKSLAAPEPDLTDDEKAVLYATRRFKSSYAGRDRREMFNMEQFNKRPIEQDQWDNAKALLIEKKLLNAKGALTTAGKNIAANIKR